MARIKRSGRRSGKPDTREEILTAARALFAAEGIESVSIRRIAAAADVDPALVHHYFGTKDELFMAAIELPIDPAPEVAATIKAGGLEGVGGRVIHTLVNIWEGPHQAKLIAVVRSGLSKPAMSLILRQLFEHRILTTLTDSFGDQIDHHRFRANLVGSQIFGLICARYILKIQPIASLDVDTLAAAVGPTIDRYLTMPVDHLVDGDLSGF